MSRSADDLSLRHITIALATSQSPSRTLDMIALLAANFGAEVAAVFIEDADMLRAVRLPFALEISRTTNTVRRANSLTVEQSLKESAERARRRITDTTTRLGTKCSFRVVRQSTSTALLELARSTDVVVYSPAARYSKNDQVIVALVDDLVTSAKSLWLARQLAQLSPHTLQIIAIGDMPDKTRQLVDSLKSESGLGPQHVKTLSKPVFADVVTAIRALHPAIVVLSSHLLGSSAEKIREFEDVIGSPIVIVN